MSDDETDSQSTRTDPDTPRLEEGVDYYLEGGLMVFTAHFLLRRGYCCESGCRHCPYNFKQNHAANPK